MSKYFRTIYLYIVTFITLCMVIVGFVGTIESIVAYAYPVINEYEIDQVYDYDKEEFDLTSSKMLNLEKVEQRATLKSGFTYLAVLVAGFPLYSFHVRQIKKESDKEV